MARLLEHSAVLMNFLPDNVDFSSLSRYSSVQSTSTIPDFVSVSETLLWYVFIFCVYNYFCIVLRPP